MVALLAIAVGILCSVDVYGSVQWYDQQRLVLAICFIVVAGCRLLPCAVSPADWRISCLLLVAVGCGVASAVGADRLDSAVAEWAVITLIFAIIAQGAIHQGWGDVSRLAALTFVVVAAPYVLGVLAKYTISVVFGENPGADTFQLYLSNPRFPAQLEALTLPLAPVALHLARSVVAKRAVALVGALWWMCVFGSASRTAWIALAVGALAVLILPGRSKSWITAQAGMFSAGAAAFLLLFFVLPDLLGLRHQLESGRFESLSSFIARLELYKQSFMLFQGAPWFGWGPMHFAAVNNQIAAHPHNFWLQHLAEWGGLSTCCVAIAVFLLGWRLMRTRVEACANQTNLQQVTVTALLAATVTWAVGCMADGYMVMPTSQALSAVVLALAVSALPPVLVSDRVTSIMKWGWRICTLTALSALLYVATTPFGDPLHRQRLWDAENSAGTLLAPRFWQQGWIGPDADPTAR